MVFPHLFWLNTSSYFAKLHHFEQWEIFIMYISVPIHCFWNFLTTMKGIWEFTNFVSYRNPHANRLPPILQILELLLLLSYLDNEENINPLENTKLLEVCTMFKSKNVSFQCYQVRPLIVGRNISSWVHNTLFSFSFLWEQTIWIFSCAPTRGYWITTNQGINLPFG